MILTKVCTCLSNQLQLLLQVDSLAGKPEPLLATVKRRKLSLFGHTTRHNTIAKAILQGTLEGKRRWGCQRKNWLENIQQWTHRDLAMHSRGQTMLARTVCEWRPYDCPDQGMKVTYYLNYSRITLLSEHP